MAIENKSDVKPLNDFDAVMICEGVQEAKDPNEYIQAWQHIVNNGQAWTLQGWFGRRAQWMIDSGLIKSAKS